jgi:hypothetical protein
MGPPSFLQREQFLVDEFQIPLLSPLPRETVIFLFWYFCYRKMDWRLRLLDDKTGRPLYTPETLPRRMPLGSPPLEEGYTEVNVFLRKMRHNHRHKHQLERKEDTIIDFSDMPGLEPILKSKL